MVSIDDVEKGSAQPAPQQQPAINAVAETYEHEKNKRLREDGIAQYIELENADSRLSSLAGDPWVDHDALNALEPNLKDGDDVKVLILGAGLGGIVSSVRLIEAGFKPEDIRMVDVAGGFGGTWYWNRYPGLMCDNESLMYLPLLEETGYMPKHRFSYGNEIRDYANLITEKWGVAGQGVFRTTVHSLEWDEAPRRWLVRMTQDRGPKESPVEFTAKAQFLIMANGIFSHPKAPKIPGIEDFAGDMVHTSRWDYDLTGGSQAEPELSKLKGRKVAIIGTGATSVQLIPELAKWADHLYVFQRTPSSIDVRGQRPTDPEEFNQMASKKGWWKDYNVKWQKYFTGYPDAEKVTDDGWSDIKGYRHLVGGPHTPYTMEEIPALVDRVLKQDLPRMDSLRDRVDAIVKDKKTADALKPWYPSWCKRPCFHDDYLDAFNLPNVTLVDTDGKGVERMTRNALIVDGEEYDVDFLVLGTGFRPLGGTLETRPGDRASRSRAEGYCTSSFPNLFLIGAQQGGVTSNFLYTVDHVARHLSYVLSETVRRAESPSTATVETTVEDEEAWAVEVSKGAGFMALHGVCGPSYMNAEGTKMAPEQRAKALRGIPYPQGLVAFEELLSRWREEGSMKGLVVSS
ncbi:FAD-binding monooxygenase ausC [Cladobotryum mycophilum]|uniref:FAD-binding monooxygenase ausC n=1 Tax=Cladobotryum mycophilum TaxID=491253 RepID=A0ABR0S8I9_9HYPO